MSLITLEVEIEAGTVIAAQPHLLPTKGRGLLTILPSSPIQHENSARVQLPIICGSADATIAPSKEELESSLWS